MLQAVSVRQEMIQILAVDRNMDQEKAETLVEELRRTMVEGKGVENIRTTRTNVLSVIQLVRTAVDLNLISVPDA
jgi:hypothetical protein